MMAPQIIRALVPISRFAVHCQSRTGRPFSALEHYVLRAAETGPVTADTAHDLFRVHPRLVIEALVTLTQEGWLAVGDDAGNFLLTDEGGERLEGRAPLVGQRIETEQPQIFVMERLTGGILRHHHIRYVPTNKLGDGWEKAFQLDEIVFDNTLPEGVVSDLITFPKDQDGPENRRLHRIERIEPITRGTDWLPVVVDLDKWSVAGLPSPWVLRLSAAICRICENSAVHAGASTHFSALPVEQPLEAADVAFVWHPCAVNAERDVLIGAAEHEEYLAQTLTNARSAVLIASAFLRFDTVRRLQEALRLALQRGLRVDLLWGYEADASALSLLREIDSEAKKAGARGRLLFNEAATRSHMKLLVADLEDDSFQAVVGSYNWMSARRLADISVRLRTPQLVRRLIQRALDLWKGGSSGTPWLVVTRWKKTCELIDAQIAAGVWAETFHADSLAQVKEYPQDVCRSRIILDTEHDILLREWTSDSPGEMLLLSHKVGPAGLSRIEGLRRDPLQAAHLQVRFGEVLDNVHPAIIDDMRSVVENGGGEWLQVPEMHAKLLLSSRGVIIGSYNYLSADPIDRAEGGRELSVFLEGSEIASRIRTRVESSGILSPS